MNNDSFIKVLRCRKMVKSMGSPSPVAHLECTGRGREYGADNLKKEMRKNKPFKGASVKQAWKTELLDPATEMRF